MLPQQCKLQYCSGFELWMLFLCTSVGGLGGADGG